MEVSTTTNQLAFNVEAFKKLYQHFDKTTLAKLPTFYSPSIVFKDPIHELNGIDALTQYFSNFCNPDTQCSFDFVNEVCGHGQIFLQWKMNYCHPHLATGKSLSLNGGSLIKFNSKIIHHEDFYDMGAMIYQHVPIVGWATKKINARLIHKVGETI